MADLARLVLNRRLVVSGDSVEGRLTLHGAHDVVLGRWSTLELPYRDNQTNASCIPLGHYEVARRQWGGYYQRYRQKFGHEHVWQVNEPGQQQCGTRGDILFHRGNTSSDTRGCILLGKKVTVVKEHENFLYLSHSTTAYKEFYAVLSSCTTSAPVPLEIVASNLRVLSWQDIGHYHDKDVDRDRL